MRQIFEVFGWLIMLFSGGCTVLLTVNTYPDPNAVLIPIFGVPIFLVGYGIYWFAGGRR